MVEDRIKEEAGAEVRSVAEADEKVPASWSSFSHSSD